MIPLINLYPNHNAPAQESPTPPPEPEETKEL